MRRSRAELQNALNDRIAAHDRLLHVKGAIIFVDRDPAYGTALVLRARCDWRSSKRRPRIRDSSWLEFRTSTANVKVCEGEDIPRATW
jgi:hypothetical protein